MSKNAEQLKQLVSKFKVEKADEQLHEKVDKRRDLWKKGPSHKDKEIIL